MKSNAKIYYDYRTYAAFRDRRNLKDADVAIISGVSADVISNWKRGRNIPRPNNIEKIARAVGATAGKFSTTDSNVVKNYVTSAREISVPVVTTPVVSAPPVRVTTTKPINSLPIKNNYKLNTLQKIKILAIVNEVTMSEVSEMVDVPLDEILTWDKEDPRVGSLKKVANTFSCTLDELVNDKYNH